MGRFFGKGLWIVLIFHLSSHLFADTSFPPQFSAPVEQNDYDSRLISAFENVLEPHLYKRFREALKGQDRTDLFYVLNSQKIFILDTFITRMTFEMRYRSRGGRARKLFPAEAAAVLLFYKSLDPKTNALVKNNMLRRSDARLADGLRQITRWPHVPFREHGLELPASPYDRKAWLAVVKPFEKLGLLDDYLVLRSQLSNFQAAQRTYYHVKKLREKFFLHLQRVAILKDNVQLAKKAFLAYLASTISEAGINELEIAERSAASDLPGMHFNRTLDTLAQFSWAFSKFDREQLLRFFSRGILPRNLEIPDTEILNPAIRFFESNPLPGKQPALEALFRQCTGR
ncbi:MAG: hypothetical protein JWQ35_1873 [Bacteriovoracaceae bacterium]|nr:hypothetical protein [Bacteriovoracaceae bacterium]